MRGVFFCVLTLSFISGYSQRDFRKEAALLKKLFKDKHLESRGLDDQFSRQLFEHYFHTLDADALYFSSADFAALDQYKTLLDNQLYGEGWTFLQTIPPLYSKAIDRAALIIQKESEKPFLFNETIQLKLNSEAWASNEAELRSRWRWKLHYATLQILAESKDPDFSTLQFFQKHEPAARARAKTVLLRATDRMRLTDDRLKQHLGQRFLESITAIHDPHSRYEEVSNVDVLRVLLNAESFEFGISLEENERGKIVVSSIAPGGPAWKAGVFDLLDEVVSIKWTNDEMMDLANVPLEKVNEILENGHSTLIFTVRKPNGENVSATIKKEKLSDDQNLVRSYVLVGNNGRRIGHIVLPDFYTSADIDGLNASRCANDVAKEILKLNKENIEGLIIDVRNNRGGSLQEAMALTGIFVEEGALGMMRSREKGVTVLKDMNRGTLYNGPMVLLVNSRSASASEFLAAALQDYHRAVIVGSRTYGKATSQHIHLLDPSASLNTLVTEEHIGFARVTTGRIYRVTGKSIQGTGIEPDVVLPEFREIFDLNEASKPYYLRPDSLEKGSFYRQLPRLPLSALQEKSDARISSSAAFQTLSKKIQWYKENRLQPKNPIDWKKFASLNTAEQNVLKAHETSVAEMRPPFVIRTGIADNQRLGLDPYAKAFHDSCVKTLAKDIYLEEGFNIINDLIDSNKK